MSAKVGSDRREQIGERGVSVRRVGIGRRSGCEADGRYDGAVVSSAAVSTDRGVERAVRELLDTWNRHQDLRRSGAGVRELWASREQLDARRRQVHRAMRDEAAQRSPDDYDR